MTMIHSAEVFTVWQDTNGHYADSACDIVKKVTLDVPTFFCPLVGIFRCSGFILTDRRKPAANVYRKLTQASLQCFRTGYLVLMWLWTVVMSINIIYMAIDAPTTPAADNKTDSFQQSSHANMIIVLLEESPFSFITIRCATVLTLFVSHSSKIIEHVQTCERLRIKLTGLGGSATVTFEQYRLRPVIYIASTVLIILLWEMYEWGVWFSTIGITYTWDMKPFPFALVHYEYTILWVVFTTIPFLLSQLALCFPVLFAYVLRRYCRYINREITNLAKLVRSNRSQSQGLMIQLGQRVSILRGALFDVHQLLRKIDRSVNAMLLLQFIFDVVVLFGFIGNLVNAKDDKTVQTLEWTFYIPSSFMWFIVLLFNFSFPLIHLAEEGERTHQLVHALTFSAGGFFKENFKDISVFLSEARMMVLAFTGGNFYYVNRHYIVTCVALIGTYLTVLTEILDRYHGTEDLKHSIAQLAKLIHHNNSTST